MPSIIFDNELKKKFEGIRGKFLSTGLFTNITRAETLELMIDSLDQTHNDIKNNKIAISPFCTAFIREILEKRKEKK